MDQFKALLNQIETISFQLEKARPDGIAEYRSQLYDQMMDLYAETDDVIGYIEYEATVQDEYALFRLKERYQDLKIGFRRAQLSSKKQEGLKEESEGEETLVEKAYLDDSKLQELTKQEQILGKNKQITQKLQNITNMMHSNLLSGEANLQDLGASTAALQDLSNKYGVFGDVLVKTNGLVKQVNAASNAERRQIYRSIYFFIFVCVYILYKRIFRRPVRLALWLVFSFVRYTFLGGQKVVEWGRPETSMVLATVTGTAEATMSTTVTESTLTANISTLVSSTSSLVSNYFKDEL